MGGERMRCDGEREEIEGKEKEMGEGERCI